ncbi:hypothetical protein CFC21_012828 [Triticum aestivum]|uniref:Leucine-rich repeat-containing N-terminal plant-type domain-containing protein n=4 Tax=Triticinae TaxID=1648030 RepID=A0A3B5ZZD7_WHEAT|nr:leucine-rich repeat protein 1-like [Aegilops tauschii subsp. strangulata]XP_044444876.1 leucine-rich repeat protein 1-like [Triticum aestivum]KAF6996493.1 hypothetical protein CFC21_012828 [Triticum aestivum]
MAPTAAGARLPLSLTVFMAVATTMLLAPAEAGLYGDRDALMALRRGLQDPDGALRSWSPELGNMNPCINWSHVTCDRVANRVTEIVIGFVNLSGPLSPELGKLGQLTKLWISYTNIQGTIPEELGNLENLNSMHLHNNSLSGQIPASLGKLKSLKQLHLQQNRLTGPIPSELDGLSDQTSVNLSSNDLCGPIPTDGPFKNMNSSLADNPRLGGNC